VGSIGPARVDVKAPGPLPALSGSQVPSGPCVAVGATSAHRRSRRREGLEVVVPAFRDHQDDARPSSEQEGDKAPRHIPSVITSAISISTPQFQMLFWIAS